MLRLIRAELFKLLKSRTFKVVCGVALGLCLLMVGLTISDVETTMLEELGITTDAQKQAYTESYLAQLDDMPIVVPGQIGFNAYGETSPFDLTPLDVFHSSFGAGPVEILIGILVGVMVAGEYSSGTIKNTLAYGKKRNHFYLAKFISLVCGAAIIVAIMTLLSSGLVALIDGWGQPFEMAHLIEMVSVYFSSLLVFGAVIAVLMLVSTLVKSNGATIGISIALFVLLPSMIGVMYGRSDWFDKIYELTLYYNTALVTSFKATRADILHGVFVSGITLITTLGLGLIVFNKQDIK
ncbi:MAG: ABC transporter permease subunit [Turicibacter sp.]